MIKKLFSYRLYIKFSVDISPWLHLGTWVISTFKLALIYMGRYENRHDCDDVITSNNASLSRCYRLQVKNGTPYCIRKKNTLSIGEWLYKMFGLPISPWWQGPYAEANYQRSINIQVRYEIRKDEVYHRLEWHSKLWWLSFQISYVSWNMSQWVYA